MIIAGDHCGVLIGDAYQKGLMSGQSADLASRAYGAMRKNALQVPSAEEYLQGKGRRAIPEYLQLGFVPLEAIMPLTFHSREQVSQSLERIGLLLGAAVLWPQPYRHLRVCGMCVYPDEAAIS